PTRTAWTSELSVTETRAYYPARAASDRDLHRRVVTQVRRKPALHLLHGHALAPGIVLDLVAVDLADVEVARFGVGEIPAAHGRRRIHRVRLGELDACLFFGIQQLPQFRLLGVIRARGVTRRRANAL